MATSQNGWPVNPARRSRHVPGTEDVRVTVADGPAGDVLIHVLAEFDRRVESLDLDSTRGELDDWGWANRPIRGGTATSNHASATAVDANATRHPLGVRGTFSSNQVREIHAILAEVDNVVRWGGDYSGRVDEMHFEINAELAAVRAVAARLSQEDDMQLTDRVDWKRINALGPEYIGHKILSTWQHAHAARVLAGQTLAAVTSNPDITPERLDESVDKAFAEHMPSAEEIAEAQRAHLEDLMREVVREVVPDEQADRIIAKLAEKLAAA